MREGSSPVLRAEGGRRGKKSRGTCFLELPSNASDRRFLSFSFPPLFLPSFLSQPTLIARATAATRQIKKRAIEEQPFVELMLSTWRRLIGTISHLPRLSALERTAVFFNHGFNRPTSFNNRSIRNSNANVLNGKYYARYHGYIWPRE